MSERHLTDARIAAGLRAHVAARSDPGLHDRILASIEATPQLRPWPSIQGVGDTNALSGRRDLLIAVALLLALLVATGAAVGAFLQWQRREAVPDLSLEPPDDLAAYMADAYLGILDLPALRIVMSDGDIWYHDGAGTVRQDRPLAGANGVTWIYTRSATVEVQRDLRPPTWVVGQPGGVDPRAQIVLSPPCCGLSPECVAGWRYVGLEYVVGRPTHHVSCGFDLWMDVALGIPIRGRTEPASPPPSADGSAPSPAATEWSVVAVEVGPQPAALFADNPDGLAVMSQEEFFCSMNDECTSPQPTAAPRSFAPAHAAIAMDPPTDLAAFVADVEAHQRDLPALELLLESYTSPPTDQERIRHRWDGNGSSRDDLFTAGGWEVAWLNIHGRAYEFFGGTWHDYGPGDEDRSTGWALSLPDVCEPGWEHRGFDTVLDRPAHHLVCGLEEFWVDDGWRLVVRTQHDPEALETRALVQEIIEVTFAPQPADLFVLPEGADVFCPRCQSPMP